MQYLPLTFISKAKRTLKYLFLYSIPLIIDEEEREERSRYPRIFFTSIVSFSLKNHREREKERNFRTSRSSKTSGVPTIKRLIGLVTYARPSFSVKLFIYCSCATRVYQEYRLVIPSSGSVRGVLLTFRRDKRNEEDRFAASRRVPSPASKTHVNIHRRFSSFPRRILFPVPLLSPPASAAILPAWYFCFP